MEKTQQFFLNDRVLVRVDYDCFMECEITEVRNEFGRIRYTIKPIAGTGEMKVEKVEKVSKKK
jgi:hypothetical protein